MLNFTLKPCPFCGGEAEMEGDWCNNNIQGYYYVECSDCGATGQEYRFNSLKDTGNPMIIHDNAINAWNTRIS